MRPLCHLPPLGFLATSERYARAEDAPVSIRAVSTLTHKGQQLQRCEVPLVASRRFLDAGTRSLPSAAVDRLSTVADLGPTPSTGCSRAGMGVRTGARRSDRSVRGRPVVGQQSARRRRRKTSGYQTGSPLRARDTDPPAAVRVRVGSTGVRRAEPCARGEIPRAAIPRPGACARPLPRPGPSPAPVPRVRPLSDAAPLARQAPGAVYGSA